MIKPADAILGCLYGQAVGDALGMPSELWPLQRVRHFFGWINDFLPGPEENCAAVGFKAGEYTDDTQQMVALMDAIIASHGAIIPERIAENILKWAEHVGAFEKNILGPTSKHALTAIRQGEPINHIVANGTTNGAAMRIAPMGCLLRTQDRQDFIDKVALACSPTHKSDIAIAGACVIAWSISRAIDGTTWQTLREELPGLAEEAQNRTITTFSASLGRRLEWAFDITDSLRGAPREQIIETLYQTLGAGMETIESIPTAIALVEIAQGDPVTCATLAANLGGDTDTIGAMATAICGALKGIAALPEAWVALIDEANAIEFQPYADALYTLRYQGEHHESGH